MTSLSSGGKNSFPLATTPVAKGYRPVRKLARLGVQTGFWQYARVKATPSDTRLSMWGVLTCGLPRLPITSCRSMSGQIQRMLGLDSLWTLIVCVPSLLRILPAELSHKRALFVLALLRHDEAA